MGVYLLNWGDVASVALGIGIGAIAYLAMILAPAPGRARLAGG